MAKTEEKPQRGAAKKLKDKWRAKGWYNIVAPEMFSSQMLGETLSDEPAKLLGRICETTVHELTGDFSRMHIKLRFAIDNVQGANAYTRYVGHELTNDYVRRMTRRKRSKIDSSFRVVTKDNFNLQVKLMAVADKRIQSSQQTQIRQNMLAALQRNAAAMTLNELVQKMISGDISKDVVTSVKAVYPLKKIEIRRTEVFTPGKKSQETAAEPAPEAVEEALAGADTIESLDRPDEPADEPSEEEESEVESEEEKK